MGTVYNWPPFSGLIKAQTTTFVNDPLADTSIAANTYGKPVPISVGNRRIAGNIIWAKPLNQSVSTWLSGVETTSTPSGIYSSGTGVQFETVSQTLQYSASYSYSATFAVSFGFPLDDRPTRLKKLWANAILIYDGVGSLPSWIRYYSGTETQTPDPAIVADKGLDAPSYRPHIYVVIENLSLTPYANTVPTITAEIETAGDSYDFLVESYSWAPNNGRDLDTRTYLTGVDASVDNVYVGWDRFVKVLSGGGNSTLTTTPDPSAYVQWFTDNTTDSGGECVVVNITKLRQDFPAAGTFDLNLRAFWYNEVRDGGFSVTRNYYKGAYDFTYNGAFQVTTALAPLKTTYEQFNVQTTISADIPGDFIQSFTILSDDAGVTSRYPLSEIITGIAGICGFEPGEVTTIGIDDLVDGAIIDSDFDFRELLGQLAGAFGFDRIEGPNGIVAIRKPTGAGFVVDRVLTTSDILDIEQTAIRSQRSPDADIANTVEIRYLDANLDYTYANQIAHRPQFPVRTTASNSIVTYTIPVVITAAECAGLTARALYELWNERLTHSLRLMPSQIDLEPSDIVSFPLNGKTYVAKLADASIGADYSLQTQCSNVWEFRADLDAEADPIDSVPPLSERVKESLVAIIDSPLVDPEDDSGLFDVYLAPSPAVAGLSWPGAQIFWSHDGGTIYAPLSPVITTAAITGDATTVLGTVADVAVTDAVNTVTLTLRAGNFAGLGSATSAQLDGGANLAVIGAPGRWEIFQYGTVTATTGGGIVLSNLRRGLRGTEPFVGTHAVGDVFVLMTGAGIYKAALNGTFVAIGDTVWFKAVGLGENEADAVPVSFVLAANAEKPFAPTALDAVIAGSDIALSWTRRDRLDPGLIDGTDTVPLSDSPEAYEVDIMDGATVKRTLTSSTTSKTYTAANIATDFGSMPASLKFRVYQMAGTLRGFRAESTITL